MTTERSARITAVLAFLLLLASPLLAQTTGSIVGLIKDQNEAVLPGVKVTATYQDTREQRTVTSNEAGQYSFPYLPPGKYRLDFALGGFAAVAKEVDLHVTERIGLDIALAAGTVTDAVTVTAQTPVLQSESSTLGRVVDESSIQRLPLSTRNFTQLLALSPGTSAPLNDAGALGRGTQNISALGARTIANTIQIDGNINNNVQTNSSVDNGFGSNGVMTPSTAAIQEFKVQTGLYDARSGFSGGANVAVVTKSGTAQFHGEAFEFFRNEALNANSFFFNRTGQPKPVLKNNQFGGVFGGPLIKDKTFFFVSYQGTRQRNGLAGSTSIRLPAIPLLRTAQTLGQAFGGSKGARGGTAIKADGSNINPVALALLNAKLPNGDFVIPSPQTSGAGANYAASIPAVFTEDQGIANLDHQLTKNNRLSARFLISNQPQFRSFPVANLPGFGLTQDFAGRNFALTDTQSFARWVNEFRAGYVRFRGKDVLQTPVLVKDIGLRRFNESVYPDLPQISVTDAFILGHGPSADQGGTENAFSFADSVSYNRGSHQMQFGGEFRRYQDNYFNNARMRGVLTFQSFADFLLGLPGSPEAQGGNGTGFSNVASSSVGSGVANRADRFSDIALFFQDDWKLTPRLSLNLGLRWDYFGPVVDSGGRNGNFDFKSYVAPPAGGSTSVGFVQAANSKNPVPGVPLVDPTFLNGPDRNNFAPRIGFAYKLGAKLVARGGYGIYYNRLSNQIGIRLALNYPAYFRTDISGAANTAASLQNPFPNLPLPAQFPIKGVLYAPPFTNDRPALTINALAPDLRTPYLQQYSLNFQYQLFAQTLLEAGYVGTKGTKLAQQRLINQALLASAQNPVNGLTTNTTANVVQRVPYLGSSAGGVIYLETDTDSRYNSLQLSLTQRLTRGLQFLASYTFSKSLDNNSGPVTSEYGAPSGDQFNLRQARGPSDFDRTHRVVVSFTYAIPRFGFGWNDTAFGKVLFDGWEIAGIALAQSGVPFTIADSTSGTLFGVAGRASFAPGATAATATKSGSAQSRLNQYFDPAAFIRVPAQPVSTAFPSGGTLFGDTGRNILRGPRQRNFDFSAIKRFALTERLKTEFRADFFNLFNFVNFDVPGSDVAAPGTFGVISRTTGNPRIIQFAAKVIF
ncbi:MAG: carboxypeptidase regulatory-like domain-containing protein [Blastocatellia bacterium]